MTTKAARVNTVLWLRAISRPVSRYSSAMPLISPAGVMVIEDIQPRFDALWEEFVEGLRTEYAGVYYPSRILRQYRDPGSAGGMAVITRR